MTISQIISWLLPALEVSTAFFSSLYRAMVLINSAENKSDTLVTRNWCFTKLTDV